MAMHPTRRAKSAFVPDDYDVIVASFLTRYSAPKTILGYRGDLIAFARWCESRSIDPLFAVRRDVELYARWMEAEGYAARTRNRRLGTVSMLFKTLILDDLAEVNPAASVRRPRIERESTTNGLRRTELADILEAAERSSNPADLALVCLLGLNGLRISEACSLDVGNIDAERGMTTIRFVRKGGKRTRAPLSPLTAWAVHGAIGGRIDGPIMLNRAGNRMNPKNGWRAVKRLVLVAGISKSISPHSFRHAFVTLSLDAGVSQRDVQASTGHSDNRMLVYYDRNRENLQRHATHTLTAYVAGSL